MYVLLTPASCMLHKPDPCTMYITYSWPSHYVCYIILTPALCMSHTPSPRIVYVTYS